MVQSNALINKQTQAKHRWWVLTAVCFGLFMSLLDVTIVNVALPVIQHDLNASFASIEWVISAYTLVFAVALVTASRLGDIYGRKTLFIIGLGIFTIGSLFCGLSSYFTLFGLSHSQTLNIFRGVQGLGGSAMMPLSLAIISSSFIGKQRGIAIGIWGGVSGLATAIGPLIGGFLVDALNWQSIFYLNVPVGLLGIAISLWAIPQSRDESAAGKIDVFGLITFTAFMFCTIYGLIRVNESGMGWTSPTIIWLGAIAAVSLIVFIIGESRIQNPMIDPRLFKVPSFTGAGVAGFCLSAGMYALFLYISLYFQNILGYDAFNAGLRLLPFCVLSLMLGPVAGALMAKVQPKWLAVVGLLFLGVGVWMMGGISASDKAADWVILVPGLMIAGFGNGIVNPPISNLAVGTVARQRSGMASGANGVLRQMGIAFGTAIFGAVLSNRYAAVLHDKINALNAPYLTAAMKQKISDGLVKAGPLAGSSGFKDASLTYQHNPLFGSMQQIGREAFMNGTVTVIHIASVILFIGALCSLLLIRQKDMKH
ncbi:MAG: MFS transporter [Sporolactobacillus sp.]